MDNTFNYNATAEKIELHFNKNTYLSLDDSLKRAIKSNYLFSRAGGAWVSRAKFPNLSRAKQVAIDCGLTEGETVGEHLTFTEKMEKASEKAERKADYCEYKAEQAERKADALQAPINGMHGDIAFFTQPNINSSAGRAFTRKRERMWASWERGMDEFRKSEYYKEKAEYLRKTASNKNIDKGFCTRRINEANATIKAQHRNIVSYEEKLFGIRNGKTYNTYKGDILTEEAVLRWIEDAEQIIENSIEKIIYYESFINDLGGVQYSKDNIKVGYIVRIARWGACEVLSAGTKNVKVQMPSGGALIFSYSEITEVVKAEEKKDIHPFKVGEVLIFKPYDFSLNRKVEKEYKIIKATDKSITLQHESDKPLMRKPTRHATYRMDDGIRWTVSLDEYNWIERYV